ncbi:MAG: TrkH family potassium uptake protein [Clostridia bacterium]|nr:TrkH family potassium uptake protein [Clostridia bacterium]
MNRNMILHTVGRIVMLEALLLLIPLAVSLWYRETGDAIAFAITVVIGLVIGFAFTIFRKREDSLVFAKSGFITVAFSWILLSLIGALPFTISGAIPSYIDAVFETVSGFTTTGASILDDPSRLSHGLLFWRSFTHWIGGMGVIVLMMAILPTESGRSIHIMRAEVPGPIVGKLVPRLRDTAKILYLIYIALTVIQVIFLLCGGMSLFDSLLYTFGTAGTGGFGARPTSVAEYSPYLQWVITVFMLIFGLNFNLYYLLLHRRAGAFFRNAELWCYLGIVAVATVLVAFNISDMYQSASETIRHAAFQVSSIITTTGYSTTDFALWPGLSKTLLLLLMMIGGCAGSTAGGLKISRIMLLFKIMFRDLKRLLHPRSVGVVQFDGKTVDDRTISGVSAYFFLYMLLLIVTFMALSWEPFSMETNLSAAISCFNNVGPGLAGVGPLANYAAYSDVSKVVLSLAMLFGRLEIYPLLFLLTPKTWSKKG